MKPLLKKILLGTLGAGLFLVAPLQAVENWPSYRGPTDQGITDAADLPLEWSESKNIAWKIPIKGKAWSSPVIWGDRSVDYKDIDAETGKPERDGDWRKAFSTPAITQVDGKDVLLSLGSMALYGYEPETGNELWRVESNVKRMHSGSCRPVVGHGLVFMPMGSGGELWAIRPDGKGTVTDTHIAWRHARVVPKRSSVLLVDDLLFMVDDGGIAACLEAKTGKEIWKERLGGNYSASPILAGGKIYFFDEEGKSTVIEAAREFKVVNRNELEAGCMASPAVSGDALFVRTKTHLYRIGKLE